MSSISTVQGLFKKFYGELKDITPEGGQFDQKIKFDQRKRVGEAYVEAIILSAETGLTLMGSNAEVVTIEAPVGGAVKQASIKDSGTLIASTIPYQTLSRSADKGDQAFLSASQHVTKNNLKSHKRFIENLMVHGQSLGRLGRPSYETTTYRGVSVTAGAATINSIVFATGGVNTTSNHFFLGRSFASNIWTGMEGLPVNELATNTIVATGKLVSVDAEYGTIEVDFTPVASSSATSHNLAYPGQETNQEMAGIQKILTNTGSLFDIDASAYSLWKGTTYDASGKLTFAKLNTAIGNAVNRGGLDGDVCVFVNPRTWATLLSDEAGLRRHQGSDMAGGTVKKGAEEIEYYAQNGKITIVPATTCKENEAFVLRLEDWYRFGSADLSFKVPGVADDLIFPLQNQTGFRFMSFASQCIMSCAPAKSIYISGVNDESAT